jgi:hypothetical protein
MDIQYQVDDLLAQSLQMAHFGNNHYEVLYNSAVRLSAEHGKTILPTILPLIERAYARGIDIEPIARNPFGQEAMKFGLIPLMATIERNNNGKI